jgi:hypothetical protein
MDAACCLGWEGELPTPTPHPSPQIPRVPPPASPPLLTSDAATSTGMDSALNMAPRFSMNHARARPYAVSRLIPGLASISATIRSTNSAPTTPWPPEPGVCLSAGSRWAGGRSYAAMPGFRISNSLRGYTGMHGWPSGVAGGGRGASARGRPRRPCGTACWSGGQRPPPKPPSPEQDVLPKAQARERPLARWRREPGGRRA